ncbi:17085_t:CDS:2, partial [Dentiscutata heterogama]
SITNDFFEEIKAQITSFEDFSYIIRCFGITRCPTSDNYIMIMDYKEDGSLHDYLYKNFKLLRWEQKLEILYTANNTPKIIVELIERCWSENPGDRPTAINLVDELQRCRQDDHNIWTEIESIEEKMNFNIPQEEPCLNYKTSENYASKTINVSKESVANFIKQTIEIPSDP